VPHPSKSMRPFEYQISTAKYYRGSLEIEDSFQIILLLFERYRLPEPKSELRRSKVEFVNVLQRNLKEIQAESVLVTVFKHLTTFGFALTLFICLPSGPFRGTV